MKKRKSRKKPNKIRLLLPAMRNELYRLGIELNNPKSANEIVSKFYMNVVRPERGFSQNTITQEEENFYQYPTGFATEQYNSVEDKGAKGAQIAAGITASLPVVGQVVDFFKGVFKKKKKKKKLPRNQELMVQEVTKAAAPQPMQIDWMKYLPYVVVVILLVYLLRKN